MDFEAVIDREFRKHRPHCGVHNLGCLADLLDFRIDDAVLVLEERRERANGQVAVLIDGHTEHGAAMLADPIRVIRPAAEQRHPERRPADDHPPPNIQASGLKQPQAHQQLPAYAADNGTVSSSKRRASRWLLISATWRRVTGPKRLSTISRYFGLAK